VTLQYPFAAAALFFFFFFFFLPSERLRKHKRALGTVHYTHQTHTRSVDVKIEEKRIIDTSTS